MRPRSRVAGRWRRGRRRRCNEAVPRGAASTGQPAVNAEALPVDLAAWLALMRPLLAVLPRFMAAFLVLPFLVKGVVPAQIRVAFLLTLALVAYPGQSGPFAVAAGQWTLWHWAGFILKEAFIGALIGYAIGMALWALGAVGQLIDTQAGFTNAQIFDPFGGHPGGPSAVLMAQLGAVLFVGFGGLQVFLQLLYESLLLWPPESFWPRIGPAFRDFAVATSGSLLEVGVRLAAPVIGALLMVELGIGLINRAAPQLNAFYFSMPIKALTSLLVLALTLTHVVDVVRQRFVDSERMLPALDRVWRQP